MSSFFIDHKKYFSSKIKKKTNYVTTENTIILSSRAVKRPSIYERWLVQWKLFIMWKFVNGKPDTR